MNKRDLLSNIYKLREKSESNKLVVFVGAGVSCNVDGMPNWNDLIVEMANAIGYSKCKSCRHKNDCQKKCEKCSNNGSCTKKCLTVNDFSSDDFLRIPQYVYNQSQKTYNTVLKRCISNKIVDAPLSKAIFEINPTHIITTNYDRLLEGSSSEVRKQYNVVISDKDLLEADKSKYIIKMHGDVLHPETIVLKEKDYLDYSQNHVLIELFVKALLADHTILFLGYSLNDYNIKLIISWINFLRSQNGLFDKDKKIGYIVLDENKVNNDLTNYFKKNSIEVLNIKSLPLIKNMPAELSNEKGKRLYSFLSIIKEPALEDGISSKMSLNNSIEFLSKHRIYDYKLLLKFLNIKRYQKDESVLRLHNEDDYLRLERFWENASDNAQKLKQLFVNVGLTTICYSDNKPNGVNRSFIIEPEINNSLFNNEYYRLYINNNYLELLRLCNQKSNEGIETGFYKHFAIGYVEASNDYSSISFDQLSQDNQISFLHNNAVLYALSHFPEGFNSSKVQQYINNLPLATERQLYQDYMDIYNGNSSKRIDMVMSLEKLKNNISSSATTFFSGGSISEIYNIKNTAYAEYYFYYLNNIFTLGFNDATKFFRPYIEALICANSDKAEQAGTFMGLRTANEKYPLTLIDFDIITKYIPVKDLMSLINSNKITYFRTEDGVSQHIVECFCNLASSIVEAQTFGYRNSSISVLANIAIILTKIELQQDEWRQLGNSVLTLFSNDEFNKRFWNVGCIDFRNCVKAVAHLIEVLPTNESSITCINSIIRSPGFYEYAINADFYSIRKIILFFLDDKKESPYQTDLIEMIDSETDMHRKIILLRLFYKRILESNAQNKYKGFLSSNFTKIGVQAIYDFSFNDWITPSEKDIKDFINKTIQLFDSRQKGVQSFPDPVQTNLECLYILHISDLADDLSPLEKMSSENPHLQFLLHPDTFDYSLVDFSNYMWENFARRKEYMEIFVQHRDVISQHIINKIKSGEATEVEKKILYGFLLDGEEIWQTN